MIIRALSTTCGKELEADKKYRDHNFVCPECNGELILKHGLVKTGHFAHISKVDCPYSTLESELHLRSKVDCAESFMTPFWTPHIEKKIGNFRPDIIFSSPKKDYKTAFAIEFQKSLLTKEEIIRRSQNYARHKIPVMWVPFYDKKFIEQQENRLSEWEKWLKWIYFNKVPYWDVDLKMFRILSFKRAIRDGWRLKCTFTTELFVVADRLDDFKTHYNKEFGFYTKIINHQI